ncbi:DUF4433 domain-containing protein [Candidatus Pseudothioglobus singularis]|nr:DUF4433 domain-containing protein [Candidatus Pseudothioglobus singularis]
MKYLVHFTPLIYLSQILNEGLYSRTKLRNEKPGKFLPIDEHRYDKKTSRISLSVTFPNGPMFYIKRNQLKNRVHEDEWAVLLINAKVLWELDCLFMPKNAAKSSTVKSNTSASSDFFNQMFCDSQSIPFNCTQDVQAEVMVKNYISPKYINSIVVKNLASKNICIKKCKPKIEVIINDLFFGLREDFISR